MEGKRLAEDRLFVFFEEEGNGKKQKGTPKKGILGEFVGLEEIVNFGLTN